jgi:hypothetical protein
VTQAPSGSRMQFALAESTWLFAAKSNSTTTDFLIEYF